MAANNNPILITGANGFIGSRLTGRFARAGYRIVAVDLSPAPIPFLAEIQKEYPVSYSSVNILNADELDKEFRANKIGGVIHSTWDWSRDPLKSTVNNVLGLTNTIEAALRHATTTRFIYIGSDAVYGGNQELVREGEPFEARVESRLYPVLKILSTLIVKQVGDQSGCRFYTAIPGGPVYGVGMSPGRESRWPIYYMLEYALRGEALVLPCGRESAAGYTHVDDLCEGVRLLYETPDPPHPVYHFGPGRQWNMAEVAEIVKRLITNAVIEVGPGLARPGDCPGVPNRGPLDILLASQELGFEPKYQLMEGMSQLLAWLKNQ